MNRDTSTKKNGIVNTSWEKIRNVLIALGIFVILVWAVGLVKETSIDWRDTFYLAAQEVLQGRSPYNVIHFLNVPWSVLPLLPMALLPVRFGSAAIFVISLAIYIYVAYKLGARGIWVVVFLMAPPVIHSLYLGNIDALCLLGFVLPPQIGLFFVLMKPQMGLIMVLYWLGESWRLGGWREVLRVYAPVTIVLFLSILMFGNWMTPDRVNIPMYSTWNASLWPWGIPFGLTLSAVSLRDRRKDYAMAASPFLAPYVAHSSWVGVVVALIPRKLELAVAIIGMWLIAVIRVMEMIR